MVVVIGKRAVNVSPEDAPDYIFGVSSGNDVSERAWQGGDIQWVRAKGSRTFNAVGPVLVAGLDYTNLPARCSRVTSTRWRSRASASCGMRSCRVTDKRQRLVCKRGV